MREIALHWVTPDDLKAHALQYRLSEWLTGEELRLLERLRSPRRQRDWLAGRLAAKELVRTKHALPLRDIEILSDVNGAPELRCANVALSIAHSAGHALVALGPAGQSVGVDLQQIRPVREDLSVRVLNESEQRALSLSDLLVFWALKEAAIKAWRTRPVPPLREIAVTLTEFGHAEIRMRSQRLTARWGRWRDFIWAWAVG
ncbi:MAG: 4'-phosphopantetheinyl transferase superfamily protein [Candidatus Bipolaricaulota bacterium]|nr:4'-phosphopantetheinyl transferase superfamily protein [Candidatus Bipolaricaulota bacterium]MDW8141120.1 4'-phosphopantetheinyl transferase superfamily protein [Candidatus Bipolaricaulota bacterium]